jgi:drug/metabolite transporter (DMT)-like permease
MGTGYVKSLVHAVRHSGFWLALLSFLVFSTHDALLKSVLTRHSLIEVGALAMVFATFFSALGCWNKNILALLKPKCWSALAGYLFFFISSHLTFLYILPRMPLSPLFVMILTTPLVIAAVAALFLREKVSAVMAAALVIGFVAVTVMLELWNSGTTTTTYDPVIIGIVAVHVLLSALRGLWVRRFAAEENPDTLRLCAVVFIAIALSLLAEWQPFSLMDIVKCAAVGGLTACGLWLAIRAFQIGPAALVGGAQYTQMVWATLFGWLFFNEVPTVWTLLGATMILVSGWLLFISNRRHEQAMKLSS